MDAQAWTMPLISHAVQVTALVLIVAALTKWFGKDRPHLAHTLWILVLLKCLMPPTWSSPTSLFSWIGTTISHVQWIEPVTEVPSTSIGETTAETTSSQFTVRHGSEDHVGALTAAARSPISSPNGVHHPSSVWHQLSRICLGMILIGFVIGLFTTVVRLWLFLKSAYAGGYRQDVQLDKQIQQLCARFGLRKRVTIRVLSRPIGPVVVGWLHPKLLLPEAIVNGKSASQLEPLLAHELIHIRRGDLWWALLQTLAIRLWWFHPLVQWAGHMVTRESERSCDEETVMSLGCTPGVYARALLDVLEHKHQLQVAPALPGVRPVDVTLKRMERIMQLGQGSHQRSPRWVWGLFMVVGAMALPSAALSGAPDDPAKASVELLTQVPPVPKAQGPLADEFENYRCDVGDLLDMLHARNFSKEEAKQRLLRQLPMRSSADLREVVSRLGLPGKIALNINLPEPRVLERELHVFELKAQIEVIKATLADLRKSGFRQVGCEVQFFNAPPAEYKTFVSGWTGIQRQLVPEMVFHFEKIVWKANASSFDKNEVGTLLLESESGGKVTRGKWKDLNTQASNNSTFAYPGEFPNVLLLDDQGIESLRSNSNFNCLSAPQVTGNSGQQFSVGMRSEKPALGTTEGVASEDTTIKLQPRILDEKTIQLSFELSITHESAVEVLQSEDDHPKIVLRVSLKEIIPSGQTLVIGGIPVQVNGQDRVLVLCVKPTIGDFDRQPLEYEPIVKALVPGFEHKLNILGPLASPEKPAILEPPTNDELLQAIEKHRAQVGDRPLTINQLPRFRLKKLSTQTDPARFVPLIGNAKLHHTLYECTLTRDAFPGIVETITIDHNYFEMVPGS